MTTSKRPFQLWPKLAALGIVLVLCGALAAFGQGNQQDTTALFEKVAPAIVTIFTDNSGTGGGYVVDAATGLVATNFHVIAPARRLTVTFPYSKDDRKKFPVEGFVAVLPGRDLALIRIKAGEKKLQSLRLAEKLPKAGEPVYGINSPTADPSYAEGRVAAIRSGQDISDLVVRLGGKDYQGLLREATGLRLGRDVDSTHRADLSGQQRRTAAELQGRGCWSQHVVLAGQGAKATICHFFDGPGPVACRGGHEGPPVIGAGPAFVV